MTSQVAKPRSMTAGARNVLRSNDSASLWNCTLSPGWTQDESEILRKALIKFGIGNWAKIIESGCLPGKTNAQMNLQLQRLLGQQSTAEFAGLHIDPKVIGVRNSKIQGPHIKRKNNCIVNTGGKLSREELRKRLIKNKETYELPESEWKHIELPKTEDPLLLLESKREDLRRLRKELENVQEKIQKMRTVQPDRMEKLKTEVTESPSPARSATPVKEEDEDMEDLVEDEEVINTATSSPAVPNTDEDLAMAIALQNEEDSVGLGLPEPSLDDETDDDDDGEYQVKKRKITKSSRNSSK
ncbi:uncharacterized protein BYT42DRAFT_613089 [Radiomyces spectabilis]|uniref:uncharacterized protein n=1 Tax=Radiomyces spectabilis TaxID=64574 RepID=UPI00221E6C45|nr:uncharacterized protein BYT42DRAFT_613089 [Radiomyces spectabilis]KAI8381299.1 hypothetical protein BYT42DRAFT_613089 [Radiomyces spectabilis]